jgi:hypothetical protein
LWGRRAEWHSSRPWPAEWCPGYLADYNYAHFVHVRIARLPPEGLHLRSSLDSLHPGWEESLDWSLLLERESFFYLAAAANCTLLFLALRFLIAWYADYRLRIPRFHVREHFLRAGAASFGTAGIK